MVDITSRPRAAARLAAGWDAFVRWFAARRLSENAILLGFAVAIGVLTALGVVAFYGCIDLAYALFFKWPGRVLPRLGLLAYRPLLTGAGIALAWWCMRRFGRGHDGMNVPDVQRAVVRDGGDVPARPALARTLASALTIGSGGSAGSEGPTVVLGAAIGSGLARAFRFSPERKITFVACACAAAISAAFNAPLAGAFFALEEILGSLSVASFSPVVVASVIAAVVSRAAYGNHPAFPIPTEYGYNSLGEVALAYPLLGVVTGLVSVAYVRTYFFADALAHRVRSRVHSAVVPWVAGALAGALVWASGGMLVGYGHLALHVEMFGQFAWYALAALAVGKILATALTLNGGGSGGVFTPSLYIGAATGASFGVLLSHLFPTLGIRPEPYALVGMGALIAGATNAPITGILLVFEMTNDFAIVVPLMLTVVIAQLVARRLEPDSLYSGWLRRRGEVLVPGGDDHAGRTGLRIAGVALAALCIPLHTAVSQEALRPTAPVALPRSAPIAAVHYDVTLDSASVSHRSIGVTMTFQTSGDAPVVLALPAWSPGHYTLLWFARRVSDFSARSGADSLPWRHLDYQTWEIIPPRRAATVTVSFAYRADTIDRAVAWTRPDFAFFNGTNLFLYPVGRGFVWPSTVGVHVPDGWRIATGLPAAAAPATYAAPNYHDLVDCPFFAGHFALDSAPVAGHWMRLAFYPESAATQARRSRYLGWLTALAPVQGAVFHQIPWDTYTVFLVSDTVVNGGGLEHHDSQMDETQFKALDLPRMSALFAHELFHAWNVKRLRPADLTPYRYDDAQPTTWLWVSEGITDYYGAVSQARAHIIDSAAFLHTLAQTIAFVGARPRVAPADASLASWIAPMDGSAGLYYAQGALAGFALDVMIRDASDNRASLDDVLRELYRTTYEKGRGFSSAEWWSAVSRAAAGRSFGDFDRRCITGREPFPFDSILPLIGLRVVADSAAPFSPDPKRPPIPSLRIEPLPHATPKAARILHGILHGILTG
jgi:CIC family chloride channel protein